MPSTKIRMRKPAARRGVGVSILVGNGGLFCRRVATRAPGAMTGFAYPEMLVQVCKRPKGRLAAHENGEDKGFNACHEYAS